MQTRKYVLRNILSVTIILYRIVVRKKIRLEGNRSEKYDDDFRRRFIAYQMIISIPDPFGNAERGTNYYCRNICISIRFIVRKLPSSLARFRDYIFNIFTFATKISVSILHIKNKNRNEKKKIQESKKLKTIRLKLHASNIHFTFIKSILEM